MKRVGGWLNVKQHNASTQSLSSLDEPQALQDAMAAAAHILNDDVDTAEALLSQGNSPYHKLGKGMTAFLRATLGFEQDIMRDAAERLADAETAASKHQQAAQRDARAFRSQIYPPGSEYALCYAESQLMSAVIAVLNESLTESIKGFYRLRKAYATLQEIADAEKRYLKSKTSSSLPSSSRPSTDSVRSARSATKPMPTSSASRLNQETFSAHSDPTKSELDDDDDDFDFVDAEEGHDDLPTPVHYQGHLEPTNPMDMSEKMKELSLESRDRGMEPQPPSYNPATRNHDPLEDEPDLADYTNHPIDLFIMSGSNLCFGILQLLLSLIPPAFSKLLNIVGFRGDRAAGIAMLWRATRYHNIQGAMAGLVTLGYYNVMVGTCDIITSNAHPRDRCRALLSNMRESYPKSRLWLLEEARMYAGDKQLEKAVEITGGGEESPLKQVEALRWFEHSLNCMYLHRYEECASGFMKCVDLNNWSHGLYYYIAGACHVELYRLYKVSDPSRARKHAVKATDLLHGVMSRAGKKRFMARQLPFDTFVTRKISKWTSRAEAWGVDFIDAIGISPIEEMIYFWNGYKRMRAEHLEHSLQALKWSENESSNSTWGREGLDEKAILWTLRAACLNRLGLTKEAKERLMGEVLNHDWSEFKGHNRDNWTLPVAHYEMAISLWVECGGERGDMTQLRECSEWLEKVAKWEAFDLDARVGLRVTTGRDTLKKCGVVAA